MCGQAQKSVYEYFNSIYLGRELLATIGYDTFLAKSIKPIIENEYEYFIIQRKGGRDIITKYSTKELAYKTFCELLLEDY